MEVPDKPDPRRSVLAFIAADNADEESSEDEEAEEPARAMMDLAQAPGEAIDWDAMLAATEASTSERSPGQQTGGSDGVCPPADPDNRGQRTVVVHHWGNGIPVVACS